MFDDEKEEESVSPTAVAISKQPGHSFMGLPIHTGAPPAPPRDEDELGGVEMPQLSLPTPVKNELPGNEVVRSYFIMFMTLLWPILTFIT